jgi:hypothetical protein
MHVFSAVAALIRPTAAPTRLFGLWPAHAGDPRLAAADAPKSRPAASHPPNLVTSCLVAKHTKFRVYHPSGRKDSTRRQNDEQGGPQGTGTGMNVLH